ncbi:MAG: redoxin domain-containing protein [Pirellulaceae bacterium]
MDYRVVLLVLLACGIPLGSDARAVEPRDLELVDLAGRTHFPLRVADSQATVLFFLLQDCPISNAYAPEINRIATEYSTRRVTTFIVYVDPELSAEEARRHATEFGYRAPVLRDAEHKLVRHAGVTTAPEVAVFGTRGTRVYRGRIDDWYTDLGKRRIQPSVRDLRDALDAMLAGRPVREPMTRAIGCPIPER